MTCDLNHLPIILTKTGYYYLFFSDGAEGAPYYLFFGRCQIWDVVMWQERRRRYVNNEVAA